MEQEMEQRSGDGRSLIEEVVERFGEVVTGKTAYGEPVERDGTTVIPVARVRFGFGGGLGKKREADEGRGGGGGAQITPVGFIVIHEGEARFQRISSGSRAFLPLAAIATAGWFALRMIAKARERR
jgi:uncharacterized spore protein YtfJ